MPNLGFQEILVIVLVALLVVGPERLPGLARQAGKWMARIRSETSRSLGELKRAAEIEDLDRELKAMRGQLREMGRELSHEVAGERSPQAARGRPSQATPPVEAPDRFEPPPPVDTDAT